MPLLTLQEESFTVEMSCPSYCPMSGPHKAALTTGGRII